MEIIKQESIVAPLYHKLVLKQFWDKFGSNNKNGIGFSKEAKLELLIKVANIKIRYKDQQSLQKRRGMFLKNTRRFKRKNPDKKFNSPCFVCSEKAQCRHHMIQLQYGGINCGRNIIRLCNRCHAEIHPWLKR